MPHDRTEHQTGDELHQARQLSLEPARPPAEVPGYKVHQFVGSGSFGEVWSATDLKTGRRVAIKFYTRRHRDDVPMLAREVEKLVVLSADRYVVQLLDVGWDADPPHYVMEFIENGSLEDRLRRGQGLSVAEAVDVFQEICTGMMHLHGKGILHCDLKPGNVLLDQDGRPRVADFGQSRLSIEQTPALGTLFYMAPEQADTQAPPDMSWDVYGLGALLFAMLTGQPPYYCPELAQQIEEAKGLGQRLARYREALLAAPPATEHRQVPGVDRALADIVDRCIATDANQRFGSVQSILMALRQRETQRARRPLMVLGLVAPLLLLAVVSIFGWWAFNQAVSQASEAVTAKAQDSNNFAAQLASRSAAEQIDEYFRVVTQLAGDPGFQDKFDVVIADPELADYRRQLADPHLNATDFDEPEANTASVREKTRQHPLRQSLESILVTRLQDPRGEFPPAASWFVCDRYGNQIASVFRDENRTLANNFAFRTYFHGGDSDFDLDDPRLAGPLTDENLRKRPIIQRPQLSAVFRSQQSQQWKVAFSAPILRYGEIEGVVAVTVDLGDMVDFANSTSQYAMLVDGRSGENEGAILEHPVYHRVSEHLEGVPETLSTTKVDLDLAVDQTPFLDPIGQTELGSRLGYGKPSFVSVEAVTMERAQRMRPATPGQAVSEGEGREATGLFVVTVLDQEAVLDDVRLLGSRLWRLGLAAGSLLLLVAVAIGLVVRRMLQENPLRLSRQGAGPLAASTLHAADTLADPGRRA